MHCIADFFFDASLAVQDLSSLWGIKPFPTAVEARSPNQGTTGTSLYCRLTWGKRTPEQRRLPVQKQELCMFGPGFLSAFLPLLVLWGSSPWFHIFTYSLVLFGCKFYIVLLLWIGSLLLCRIFVLFVYRKHDRFACYLGGKERLYLLELQI